MSTSDKLREKFCNNGPTKDCDRCGSLMIETTIGWTHASGVDDWNCTRQQIGAKDFLFAARGPKVYNGEEWIANCKSSTFAKRIANALNKHKPNERGV